VYDAVVIGDYKMKILVDVDLDKLNQDAVDQITLNALKNSYRSVSEEIDILKSNMDNLASYQVEDLADSYEILAALQKSIRYYSTKDEFLKFMSE
jgi:hypothetical protein